MNKETLKRMALQVGELLCQSPETGKALGIWEICKSTGVIGLGTPEGDEFWILETLLHESCELEVKGLNLNDSFETMLERLQYAEKSERNAQALLSGALLLLSEKGIAPTSRELLDAAARAESSEINK